MSIINKVIPVTGEKIKCMLIEDNCIKFHSSEQTSSEEFIKNFGKTLSLSTTSELSYDKIKAIRKESDEDKILIKSNGMMTGDYELEFKDNALMEEFFAFMEKEKGFTKTETIMTPLKGAQSFLIGAALSLAGTIFSYNWATKIAIGTADLADGNSRSERKQRFLENILDTLGPNGVLVVGSVITLGALYFAWKRYNNPPLLTEFIKQ